MAVAVFYSSHKKSLFVAHSTNNFLFLCSHNLKKCKSQHPVLVCPSLNLVTRQKKKKKVNYIRGSMNVLTAAKENAF